MPITRHLGFLAGLALAVTVWWRPLRSFIHLALTREDYSYLLLVIGIVVALLCFERWDLPGEPKFSAMPLCVMLATLATAAWLNRPATMETGNVGFSFSILLLVVFLLALFVTVYGWEVAARMRFPLLLLLLAVPLPNQAVSWLVTTLQHGSADAAAVLFRIFHVPVVREGLVFSFSKIEIEVAQECSGIRSSTILVITTLVLAQLFLRSGINRILVVLWALFVGVAKNGFRIFTLSLLGEYVSINILDGPLHHHGGPVFFTLGLALIIAAIWLLRKKEASRLPHVPPSPTPTGLEP
jgi:exosortase